jgi:hypothetical protein
MERCYYGSSQMLRRPADAGDATGISMRVAWGISHGTCSKSLEKMLYEAKLLHGGCLFLNGYTAALHS